MTVAITCPYCGQSLRQYCSAFESTKTDVITCDIEQAGCGEEFILRTTYKVEAEVFGIKEMKSDPKLFELLENLVSANDVGTEEDWSKAFARARKTVARMRVATSDGSGRGEEP